MDLQEEAPEAPPPSSTESQPPQKDEEKTVQEHQTTPTVGGSAARDCLEENNQSIQTSRSDIDPILLKIVQDRANQNEPTSPPRDRGRRLRRSKTIETIDRTQEPPQTQSRARRGLRRVKTMQDHRTAPPAMAAVGGSSSRDCLEDNSKTSQISPSDMDPFLVKIVQDRANQDEAPSKQQQVAEEGHQAVVYPCHPLPHPKDAQEPKLPGAFPVQPTSRKDSQSFHSSSGGNFHQSWGSSHDGSCDEDGFGQSSSSWRQSSFHAGSLSNDSLDDDCSEHSCHSRCVGGPAATLPIAAEVVGDVDLEAEIEQRVKEEVQTALQKSSGFTRHNSELQHSTTDMTDTNNQEASSELIQDMFGARASIVDQKSLPRSKTGKWICLGTIIIIICIIACTVAIVCGSGMCKAAASATTDNPWSVVSDQEIPPPSSTASSPIISHVPKDICLEWIPGQGKGDICTKQETLDAGGGGVGNLLAFSRLHQVPAADISLLNAGEIKTDILRGNFTEDDLNNLLPYDNELLIVQLTGKQISLVLEEALQFIVDYNKTGPYPYAAGLRYDVDYSKDFPNRCSNIEVNLENWQGNDKLDVWESIGINDERVYHVITNSYLTGGGDGYLQLTEAASTTAPREVFVKSLAAFRNFVVTRTPQTPNPLVDPVRTRYSTQSFNPGSYNFSSF